MRLPLLAIAFALWVGTAMAQGHFPTAGTGAAPNYDAWNLVARRSAEVIAEGRAPDAELSWLRRQLLGWRVQFGDALGINAGVISTLQAQLASLGPAPESGESPTIATRRAELEARLAEATTPVLLARIALGEAEGLIDGIDSIARQRYFAKLLRVGPSALNPAHWPTAGAALAQTATHAAENVTLSGTFAWMTLGMLALAFVRLRAHRMALQSPNPPSMPSSTVALQEGLRPGGGLESPSMPSSMVALQGGRAALVFVGNVIPVAGIVLLVLLLPFTEWTGLPVRTTPNASGLFYDSSLVNALNAALICLFCPRWLGQDLFPASSDMPALGALPQKQRAQVRRYAARLGEILGLAMLLGAIASWRGWAEEVNAVVFLAPVIGASILLWQLAAAFRAAAKGENASATANPNILVPVFMRLMAAVAIAGPFLVILGCATAARMLVFSLSLSLALFAAMAVLYRGLMTLYTLVMRRHSEGRQSLMPVVFGFVLTLAALPLLSLAWGAQPSDLAELWQGIAGGVSLGNTIISPGDVLALLLVFFAGFMLTRLLQGTLKHSVLPRTKLDVGGQNALVAGIGYAGITLAAIVAITSTGIDLSSIALLAGALSLGIGFGLQNVVSNFVSGLILLIERPISEGDWVQVGGTMGYVRDISVRSTRIETFDRTDVIVPNADLVSGTVTNYTRGNTVGRVVVPVGVAYGTDTRRVEALLREAATSHPVVAVDPPPLVTFQGFGASSLDFEIRAVLTDVTQMLGVRSELNHEIARRFQEEGIEIPFTQTDIWLRNPEALSASAGAAAEADPKEAKP